MSVNIATMYKIMVIAHQLKAQKVAKFGDIVSESELQGNVKDLLASGFVAKATKEEVDAAKKVADDSAKDTAPAKEKELKDMNKAELEAKAKELGVDISSEKNNAGREEKIKGEIAARAEREELVKKAQSLGIPVTDEMSLDAIKDGIAKLEQK